MHNKCFSISSITNCSVYNGGTAPIEGLGRVCLRMRAANRPGHARRSSSHSNRSILQVLFHFTRADNAAYLNICAFVVVVVVRPCYALVWLCARMCVV